MKYSLHINQAGVVDAGLHTVTDANDWFIMGYIEEWQASSNAQLYNDHIWLNLSHMIEELPLITVRTKGGISKRIAKLCELGLITKTHDDFKLYVRVTDRYLKVACFRVEAEDKKAGGPGLSDEVLTDTAAPDEGVSSVEEVFPTGNERFPQETGVFPPGNGGVSPRKQGVSHRKHRLYNYTSSNQGTVNQGTDKNTLSSLEKDPNATTPEKPPTKKSQAIDQIFSCWVSVMNHKRAHLDDKRKRTIARAIGWGYSVEDLQQAIRGCAGTPHNMGENDRGQRYDGIELIMRSADQIDRFIKNYHNPPVILSKQQVLEQANARVAENWVPPEIRNAS